MTMRIRITSIAHAGLACLACLLVACSPAPPEQALRGTIEGLQAAIERRDSSELRAALDQDFIGPGGLDNKGAARLAQGLFLRHRKIGVILGPLDIQLLGEHATVRFTAALTGGDAGLLPDSGRIYAVTSGWRLEDGDWHLTSIDWKPR